MPIRWFPCGIRARPRPRRLAFTTSGRTDWTDGPKKILSVGDAAPVRDLEPELQFGVFNRMHVPVWQRRTVPRHFKRSRMTRAQPVASNAGDVRAGPTG